MRNSRFDALTVTSRSPNNNQTEVGNYFFSSFIKKVTKAIPISALFPELNHSILPGILQAQSVC